VKAGADRQGEIPAEYSLTTALPYVPSPVAKDGLIFLWTDGGVVHCIRASDGETLWRERASGPAFASPVLAGDTLIGCSKTGEVVALHAGEEFKVLGKSDVGEPVNATPALAGGKMLLRTETRLIAVSGKASVVE
jgi:outer membrane protein assembly factor BamB